MVKAWDSRSCKVQLINLLRVDLSFLLTLVHRLLFDLYKYKAGTFAPHATYTHHPQPPPTHSPDYWLHTSTKKVVFIWLCTVI